MYRLKDKTKCPPKGFQWVDPETTFLVEARNYSNWRSKAIEHRVANGHPIPEESEMEDQLCARYSPEIRRQYCNQVNENEESPILGVGGTLKSMLSRIGINACWSCVDWAKRMDAWGPDGCEEHMEEIVATMQENANRRDWFKYVPFKEAGSEALVRLAIHKVRNQ